ncbi:hypothetical protein LOC68_15645 [Blastopirellula sp. JC732]|uniref:Uncharacterized protein n=1 Tax=Blastopirellula sediminis TaxID=2894196 RepID=A0A9X1MMF6_9BACT|nr:hypothetical protein [Blastopirellula sediminis]MCC9606881.1 hypothetical protein [Blastopirellula sediminis]MCC9629823.1 hypothetical protein [Blastopirellula sediminis]
MLKYLLTTDDGEQVVVTPTQAGEMIQTPSGRTVEVPPLREMRTLPLYEEDSRSQSTGSRGEWNRAAGLLFAVGFVIMLIGLAYGSYVMMNVPEAVEVEPLPKELVVSEFQKLPASESLDMWKEFSEKGYLDKIRDLRTHPEMVNIVRANQLKFAAGGFGVGVIGLAIVAVAAVMGTRSKRG